jgi:hypothetical protein
VSWNWQLFFRSGGLAFGIDPGRRLEAAIPHSTFSNFGQLKGRLQGTISRNVLKAVKR